MNSANPGQYSSTRDSAHSSGISEQSTNDELIFVNSVSESENMKRMDRINTSFSDWHFVEKSVENSESDDDSIVIIEREVCGPLDSASVTDNESDNDEIDNFTDMISDSHSRVSDENVQAVESFNQITESKRLHCLITYLIVATFITIGLVFSLKNNAEPIDLNTLTQLQSNMRLRKTFIDDLFAYQVEMLNHVKRISDDMYALNIRQFAQSNQQVTIPTKENAIIHLLDSTSIETPPCEKDVVPELLPIVCLENDDVILMLTKDQLTAAFNDIVNFLQETGHKYSSIDDSLIHALSTKSTAKFDEKTSKESFVQDCDNFSKNYRPNFCSKTQDFDSCLKNAEGVCVDDRAFSFDKGAEIEIENTNVKNVIEDKRTAEEFKNFIKKFKDDFERLYRVFMDEIDRKKLDFVGEKNQKANETEKNVTKVYVRPDESNENVSVENDVVESSHTLEVVGTTVTGEWLLNLNAARAKLREYYDKATKGDWFLELGKSRENWRTGNEDEKPTEDVTEKYFARPHKERSKKKDKSKSFDNEEHEKRFKESEEDKRNREEHEPWYKLSWDDSKKWFKHENKPWRKVWDSYKKWYKRSGEEESKTDDEHKPWYKMSWQDSKKWFKKGDDDEKPWYKKSWENCKGWYRKENDDHDSWYSWSKKPVDDAKEWYNKYDSKKLKNDFKKLTTKWKSHFKKLKEGILDNYEKYVPSNLQIDLRNMWHF